MVLTKIVDGINVELTPEEEAARISEEANNDIARLRERLREQFISAGVARVDVVWPELQALYGDRMIEAMNFIESLVTHGLVSFSGADAGVVLTRDIRDFVRNDAIPLVNGMTTLAELQAVDPGAPAPFGVGQPVWPV